MANPNSVVPVSEIVDLLSLKDLCRICGSSADWVIELVEEGILEPAGHDRPVWRFESTSITVVRKVQRLQTDLRLNTAGVAVVLTLVEQNASLKQQLRLLEIETRTAIAMSGPKE